MASNLPGGTCIGQHSVCLLRASKLDSDCSPFGGADSGIVTIGIVTLTATPDIEEGVVIEPKNGCGTIAYTYTEEDKIKRWNLTGELVYHDWEAFLILFGGRQVVGAAGGTYAGMNIGHTPPDYTTTAQRNGVYLEVITRAVSAEAGDCAAAVGGHTPYVGHIFPKVKLYPGEQTFAEGARNVPFTGTAVRNPNIFNGPWNDWVGTGYVPAEPYTTVGYSQAQYDAMLAVADCGFQTLPAAS
jgi:hypothetical protein